MTNRLPAIFFGHGNPMNALDDNAWTRAWSQLGARIPRPRAILAISAHWYLPGTHVTAMTQPRTIHDFGGFPRELYDVRYPAPGDPALASRVHVSDVSGLYRVRVGPYAQRTEADTAASSVRAAIAQPVLVMPDATVR